MEQLTTTTTRTALKYGLIFGVVYMVYTTILYTTGQAANSALAWVSFLISAVGMVLAMKEFRTENGGFMTYGQGLGIGTMVSAVSGFIWATYSTIYNQFIDTTLRQQILDKMRSDFEEKGMEDAQIDSMIEMTEKMSSPGMSFISVVISAIIMGFIISLVVSAIMKKEKPFELD
ncbi:MAG: DUF4199 domain-containing protein [Runella slithyformis]|jgi:hypothetical protein|nr:MAG: DUF4199 domain-containing protein [Runella slithyformis]TAG22336.1 MAG: DUF4199 domain-containing protein [Cytophagales bacterium]TAG41381.1 MAG: DUF4199 domain-containing protein [Cytophagia bacterium]TAF80578.1 MAG: DUF4199 domain-containing protein [Runella slithyformis]TAG66220.1 MAG: DUF4199 domain-containing protein [Runella slithyformis]